MVSLKILYFLLHIMFSKAGSMEAYTNSENIEMVPLTRNSAHDEKIYFMQKGSYHSQHDNKYSQQEIDKKKEENVRKEVQDNLTNQALLSNNNDELYDNHLIEKRENRYLENGFIAPRDTREVSKYGKYSESGKLKKPLVNDPKRFRGNYEVEKLEKSKYSETQNEPHYAGDRLEYETMEESRKLSKSGNAHTRSNNALRKRTQNEDSSRNIRSRQSIKGMRKSQNNVKPSKQSLNKIENRVRSISDSVNSLKHFHEKSNNFITPNDGYFQTHKKRSSTENSEGEIVVGYSSPGADSPDLLLNTNINKENVKNNQNGVPKFNEYGIGNFDAPQGENSDYEGNNEKPISAEDDINLYLDTLNVFPNSSTRIINGYRSKPSQFSNNKVHLNPLIHTEPTNPVQNANDNNLFQNISFTLPADELITELNQNINQEENNVEKLSQDTMEQFANNTLSELGNGDINLSWADNATNKDVFDDHTTEMVQIDDKDENNTFLEINTVYEVTVSEFSEVPNWPLFSDSTESTTEVTEIVTQEASTEKESKTYEKDESDDKLANEVILKVLKKVKENEMLRQHILPSLEINSDEIKNRKNSHKATCKLDNKSVITKMSHELESMVEHEVRDAECLVLSPEQKSSLTHLLEFAKKGESNTENSDEKELKKLVKSGSKDTDTSFAEAMTKKIATLKHLLSQYEKLSEDEKLKVHNVHEYLIEQLNNVYRLINLEESHDYETHFSHVDDQNLNSGISHSPFEDVDLQKINSADSGEKSKQNKNNEISAISDGSRASDHSMSESSIAHSLSNILDTLKKHISKNGFNRELQKNVDSDTKQNKHLLKIRNSNDITEEINGHANLPDSDKRSAKSRAKRKSENQNHGFKSGGISSAYYTLALLAKEK